MREVGASPVTARFIPMLAWREYVKSPFPPGVIQSRDAIALKQAVFRALLLANGVALLGFAFGVLVALRGVEQVLAGLTGRSAMQVLQKEAAGVTVCLNVAGKHDQQCQQPPPTAAQRPTRHAHCRS
jgi:hypothetical protein